MKNQICLLSLLTLLGCSNEKKPSTATPAKPAPAAADTNPSASATAVSGQQRATAKVRSERTGKWTYEKTTDRDGNAVKKASILSPDSIRFGFPYEAGSTATLTVRNREGNTTAYLEVSNGQFNRSFQGGTTRIQFDNGPFSTYAYSAAANGRANIIFFDSAQKLVSQLEKAQTTTIEVEFHAQGKRSISFRTAGLNWSH